jgi:hypothetical protein
MRPEESKTRGRAVRFRSRINWRRNSCRTGTLLGMLGLAMYLAFVSEAKSPAWKNKDWTRWTAQDCLEVLRDSPWGSTIVTGGDNAWNRVGTTGPIADVVSSLIIRQVIVRQHQLGIGYGPEQMKQDALCLSENFDDRLVFRLSGSLVFKTPPDLIVSGKSVHPIEGPKVGAPACVSDWGNDISYPKFVDGKSIFHPGENKLVIKTNLNDQPSPITRGGRYEGQFIPVNSSFEFNTKNMVYKGQSDF